MDNCKRLDGLSGWCRVCTKKSIADRYARLPEEVKRNRKLKCYGITAAEQDEMLKAQRGLCAICDNKMQKPNVDHCHKTGKVRGLLCTRCNLALVWLETPGWFKQALAYLARHKETEK